MSTVVIRSIEKFAEPEFSRLQNEVFAALQEKSSALTSVLNEESQILASVQGSQFANFPPMRRLAAYDGEELVGWSIGHMERGGLFHMANSGVIASRRRQGIYTSLLQAVRTLAKSEGAVGLRSQHSVLNNPVLIAKLHHDFHITGISHSVQMGALVELTHHFSAGRQEMYQSRVIPYVPDSSAAA
jgi:hypothetical protein